MGFLPVWFGHLCLLLCVFFQYFWSQIYLFVAKDQQLELSDISGVLFFYPFQSMESIAVCIIRDFQQPSVIGALSIYCLSESLPRTGSKILWRDFQLGKCEATRCSKSFKTLYPRTASATPHCRISQSFPRCTEWVVSFLSQLQRTGISTEQCLFAVAVFSLIIFETENQVE